MSLSDLRRYGLALVSTGAALEVSLLLQHAGFHVPQTLLLFAVAVSALYGGSGPGVLAAFLSIIAFYWNLVEPVRTIYVSRTEIPFFITFVAFAALLCWFGTLQRRMQQELRRNQVYLDEGQRLAHTGSWALDIAGDKYVYVSKECLRMYGFDPEGPLPSREAVFQRIHPEDRESVERGFHKSVREKVDASDELRIVLPDATVRHFHVIRHPVLNGAREVVQLIGTSIDITERKRAEEAVRESEVRYRTLWEHDADALCLFDEQHRIVEANRVACEGQGYTREEVIGMVPSDFDPDIDAAGMQRIDDEIAAGKIYRFESRNQRKDGTVFPVEVCVRPLQIAGRRFHLAMSRDITERKRVEQQLRTSEAYLVESQRLTHTGSWALDVSRGQYSYWSEEMFRIFEFDPKAGQPAVGQVLNRIDSEDRGKVEQAMRTTSLEGDTDFEFKYVLPKGSVKHIHCLTHPVFGVTGEVLQVVGTVVDITESKQAQGALRESEARFRTFVDHAADAFFMLELETGAILDVNRPACDSLGYTREELIGKTPLAFDVNLDQASLKSIAERAAGGETILFDRHWHRRKDGSTFPVEVHTSVFWHAGRRFLLKVARDITDRVRAEEQGHKLRQLETELAHTNRVSILGELAASIAHEVNQPLSGIVSNASASLRFLAGDSPNVEEAREAAADIVRDGKRAGEIIARVRGLTRRAETPKVKLDMNAIIREILELVDDEAKKRNVTIRPEFADECSPVVGDRIQLQQLMLNLILNGMEAMSAAPKRELTIVTRNLDSGDVQITVRDSGVGLDQKELPNIFKPFYTTKATGMGMGLSICCSIVHAHDGKLWAAPNDGPGASFHFTLPKYQAEANARLAS